MQLLTANLKIKMLYINTLNYKFLEKNILCITLQLEIQLSYNLQMFNLKFYATRTEKIYKQMFRIRVINKKLHLDDYNAATSFLYYLKVKFNLLRAAIQILF